MTSVPLRWFGSYSFNNRKHYPSSGITIDDTTLVIGNPSSLDIRIELEAVTGLQPFVSFPFLAWGLRIEHRETTARTPIFLRLPPTLRPSRIIATLHQGLSHAHVDRTAWKTLFPC